MKFAVEPGEFEIMVGSSSRDVDLQKVILSVV
jgi:beta-glucosidase